MTFYMNILFCGGIEGSRSETASSGFTVVYPCEWGMAGGGHGLGRFLISSKLQYFSTSKKHRHHVEFSFSSTIQSIRWPRRGAFDHWRVVQLSPCYSNLRSRYQLSSDEMPLPNIQRTLSLQPQKISQN
jgi:hypothetical protein